MKTPAVSILISALAEIETTDGGSAARLRLVEQLYAQAGGGAIETRGLFGGPITVGDATVALMARDMQRVVDINWRHSTRGDVSKCLAAIRFSLQRLIVMLCGIDCAGLTNRLSGIPC